MAHTRSLSLTDIIIELGIPGDIRERLANEDTDIVLENVLGANPEIVYAYARLTKDRKYLAKARSALVEKNPPHAINVGQLKKDRVLLKMGAQAAIKTEPERAYWAAVELNDHSIMLGAFRRLAETGEFDNTYTIGVRYDYLSRNDHRRERAALRKSFVELDVDAAYKAAHVHTDVVLRRMAGSALLAKDQSRALRLAEHYGDISLQQRAIIALFKTKPQVAYDAARALRDQNLIVRARNAFVANDAYIALKIAQAARDQKLEYLAAYRIAIINPKREEKDSARDSQEPVQGRLDYIRSLKEAYISGIGLKDTKIQKMVSDALIRFDPVHVYELANNTMDKALRLRAIKAIIARGPLFYADIVKKMYA